MGGGFEHLKELLARQSKRKEIGVPIDCKLLISVGELNTNKNHETVIRAIADIKDVYYVIAGTGDLEGHMRKVIDELGLNKRVKLLGYRSDIPELDRASDVFVFPSIREGLGLAALEGMAAGLPLVISRNRGSDDFARDGVNAYVCPWYDSKAFRDAIKKIIELGQCCDFGIRNQGIADYYALDNINKLMHEIYKGLSSLFNS